MAARAAGRRVPLRTDRDQSTRLAAPLRCAIFRARKRFHRLAAGGPTPLEARTNRAPLIRRNEYVIAQSWLRRRDLHRVLVRSRRPGPGARRAAQAGLTSGSGDARESQEDRWPTVGRRRAFLLRSAARECRNRPGDQTNENLRQRLHHRQPGDGRLCPADERRLADDRLATRGEPQ